MTIYNIMKAYEKHMKGLYDNIGVLISDNSLSSEILILVILVLYLQIGVPEMLMILTKILLIQD